MDFITALKDTPLPTILVIGGFIFLFLGIATIKKPIVIDVTPSSRKTALVLGIVLIGIGLYLIVLPISEQDTAANSTPTPPITEVSTSQILIETSSPIIISTATLEGFVSDPKMIVISEVLGNPCGSDSRNEFVELYNSGENPVNVSGLWITDGEEADTIVSWQSKYPSVSLGSIVKVDSTSIPPHGFAVILAPGYPFVSSGRIMPYIFPEGTLILTIADGQLLGDESDGIEVTNRDTIVLYQGSKSIIEKVISTYGSPIIGNSTSSIRDDGLDHIPFSAPSDDCWSVERIIPVNSDIETNWEKVQKSSPGNGNYP